VYEEAKLYIYIYIYNANQSRSTMSRGQNVAHHTLFFIREDFRIEGKVKILFTNKCTLLLNT